MAAVAVCFPLSSFLLFHLILFLCSVRVLVYWGCLFHGVSWMITGVKEWLFSSFLFLFFFFLAWSKHITLFYFTYTVATTEYY